MKSLITLLLGLFVYAAHAQTSPLFWSIQPDRSIVWNVQPGVAHTDHVEMSGLQLSAIITYGVNPDGTLLLKSQLVFPMLRTLPNDTHASFSERFDMQPEILVNGTPVVEQPTLFQHKGVLQVVSKTGTPLQIERTLFPSTDKAVFTALFTLRNISGTACSVTFNFTPVQLSTPADKGAEGVYLLDAETSHTGTFTLAPGQSREIALFYSGRRAFEKKPTYSYSYELAKRKALVNQLSESLVLNTPNDTLNMLFAFAKLRAAESIYDTRGGLMHGPGGGRYYAAIWANDQAEYVNPFFPFLGNLEGNESALNSFRHFARFMNPGFKPIPSSIIAEGESYWNGAGDRGDQAMIAYGASRFALSLGNRETGRELWPLISWCLEYLERKKSEKGVIFSDSDELEGRFPAGKYNLSTNSLAYGALLSAADLASELGKPDTATLFRNRAKLLATAMESYFGAEVEGFNTYRYYSENNKLRAWICIPLTMGIFTRREATINALLSPRLWTENGILTESGSTTFWDRATLYAFRGLLASGATERVMPYLSYYSARRLLGDHVPYPVEAWPEGNQRHLSAESGLYCRVITEGLFGITPTGFSSFTLEPRLPEAWNQMELNQIKAFGTTFDIRIARKGKKLAVTILQQGKKPIQTHYNNRQPLHIQLQP